MNAHSNNREDVLTEYASNPHKGLSAAQAQGLLEKHGPNKLKEKKKKTTLSADFPQWKPSAVHPLFVPIKPVHSPRTV